MSPTNSPRFAFAVGVSVALPVCLVAAAVLADPGLRPSVGVVLVVAALALVLGLAKQAST